MVGQASAVSRGEVDRLLATNDVVELAPRRLASYVYISRTGDVSGGTFMLAVAPPDAPGRILLDASGLSPDAGEAFAATVFAAAEAPRGRVIP